MQNMSSSSLNSLWLLINLWNSIFLKVVEDWSNKRCSGAINGSVFLTVSLWCCGDNRWYQWLIWVPLHARQAFSFLYYVSGLYDTQILRFINLFQKGIKILWCGKEINIQDAIRWYKVAYMNIAILNQCANECMNCNFKWIEFIMILKCINN